jgi:hypothetical protein
MNSSREKESLKKRENKLTRSENELRITHIQTNMEKGNKIISSKRNNKKPEL